jgi:hypothetical protein
MACIAKVHPEGLWGCECRECVALQDDAYANYEYEGPSCSICDGLGHGYPGGGPCPLEERGRDDGFDAWEESRGVRELDPQWA